MIWNCIKEMIRLQADHLDIFIAVKLLLAFFGAEFEKRVQRAEPDDAGD
jgi:hypothetical protein